MRITLEFTEPQAKAFQQALTSSLESLVYQEATLKDALEKQELKEAEVHNLNDYLASLTPQRILVAEVLHTLNEAEKKTSIVSADMTDFKKLINS
jgi:hypothetical protein